MNPENPYQPNDSKVHNPLAVMQSGEQVVCEIKRHPIGLIGIYGIIGFLIITVTVLVFAVAPSVFSNVDRNQVISIGSLLLLVTVVFGAALALINHVVYWGNRWVVTTDSVTQVQQTSLFNKQSSQLSLENLEDVTAEQNGILTHIFNYGVIKAETAGERSKFVFLYCPNPNFYAQQILNARERFMQDIRTKEASRLEASSANENPPAQPPAS